MTACITRFQAKKEQSLKQKCDSLYLAVHNRNIAKAIDYLKAGALPDYIYLDDNMGFTPFHAAIPRYEGSNEKEEPEQQKHIDLLNLLISNKYNNNTSSEKLNIFSEDVFGFNPFEWAVADGKNKCVHWFLTLLSKPSFESIANTIINRQNKLPSTLKGEKCKRIKNQTPIHLAVKSEDLQIVQQLTTFTPRPNVGICDNNNMNAIHLAIERRLSFILYELISIATINDLNVVNNSGENAMTYSQKMYQQSLITAVLPCDILKSWQCKEIIAARINHSLCDKWDEIRKQKEPTHNAGMIFWKFKQEKNPNTNILKTFKGKSMNNIIHKDIENVQNEVRKKNINKYSVVSFKEACNLQHCNDKWITNYYGELNVNERYKNIQHLSPFANNLKSLFINQRTQLNFTYEPEEKEIIIRPKKGHKRLSDPVFVYGDEWIKVEAINKDLDKELTLKDRIQFYEMSIGKYKGDNNIEIREINDITHPCKRYNSGAAFGLFATCNISKKTIILEYTGLVCSENEYEASLGYGRLERFDSQWRIFGFESFKPSDSGSGNSVDRLIVDAAYYSNESVFVNDANYDDVFNKWSQHNVSFFEIRINGWPHPFLRAYNDIEKGEELLANYGNDFWKNYQTDMKISESLNKYYLHRLQRDKEVKDGNNGRKRKRNVIDENSGGNNEVLLEPMNKKRKMDNLSVEQQEIDCKLDVFINEMNNSNNNGCNGKLAAQLGSMYKLWKNAELKHNEYVEKQCVMIGNMEEKLKTKMGIMKKELNEKGERNKILQDEIDIWRENEKIRKKKLVKLNESMCGIINDVEMMSKKKDDEIERLKEENKMIQKKFNECVVRKQKYKELLSRERQQKNDNV